MQLKLTYFSNTTNESFRDKIDKKIRDLYENGNK